MIDRKRHWILVATMAMVSVIIGVCGVLVIGRTQVPYWIIYGGNTDPGDGNGGGMARDQMIAGGWVDAAHSYQVQWQADISQGTARETNAAMPAGHAAVNAHCGNGCIIAGFSLGTAPAIQLGDETGMPSDDVYLFGGPQPSTGIWHQPYIDNPFVAPWVALFGNFKLNRAVRAGTQVFYDTRDPFANSAPSCGGPGLFALSPDGHYIISRDQAASSHIWTDPGGALMHEVGYQPTPFGLPRSGSDESMPWDFCPPKVPSHIPMAPGDPGVPSELKVGG